MGQFLRRGQWAPDDFARVFEGFLADTEKGGLLDEKIRIVDTDTWKALYSFQRDGVKGAINRIIKHNGCIIADSVGLGKTFEALAIIKYFELKNERVLVLCPKRLRENWTVYRNNDTLNPFIRDRFRFDVLSHTDLSREGGKSGDIDLATFNWGNFDLVVIDESHNFRNNTKGRRDEDGNVIRKSRYERLMDDIIRSGVRTKVLLLSATPVNNDLRDLRNQLYFLTENRDDAFAESLGIGSLKETLATAQRQFSVWAKQQSHERKTSELLERLSSALFKLLDELTIARSRKHIHRYYKESIAGLGGFPERLKPISRYSPIDLSSRFLSYDKLNDEISGYKLSLFNPTFYLKPEFKSQYPADTRVPFTQADRESYLIAMMKVNFLKRLESSVKSFEITMERTIGKIETLEQKIRQFQRLRKSNDDIDLNELGFDTDDEEVQDVLEVGSRIKYKLEHLRLEEWLKDLRKDRDQLRGPHLAAKDMTIERDAKFQELKELIAAKISNPTINKRGEPNRKVLVFTAFADTASYLYDNLKDWAFKERGVNIALVSGGSVENRTTLGRNNFNHIIVNFSPRSKSRAQIEDMPQQGEIDILIATDCISEGQNLQDCDYLVNYDIHWNPVRIIQRFGRIDRIGSVNKTVQLVNFWPTEDLNKYINLKNRVEARMALVDIAATFEDNILSNEDIRDLVSEDLKYRDKQLLRLQKEILDLEDFSESISLNEFTLDDFRMELIAYIEANRKALQEAPFGLYAVVPPVSNHPIITPGVIFCFKQKAAAVKAATEASRSRDVNPLQPYFLVYVREDKEVRYTFAHPKQILDILRQLCRDRTAACDELCELFDAQTSNGSDMRFYTELLSAAVDSITRTFQKRVAAGLQQGRDFVIPDKQEQARDAADFELVTWLVIKQA